MNKTGPTGVGVGRASPLPCYLLKISAAALVPVDTVCWAVRLPEPSTADPELAVGSSRRAPCPLTRTLLRTESTRQWPPWPSTRSLLPHATHPACPRAPASGRPFTAGTEPRPLPVEAAPQTWAAPGRGRSPRRKPFPSVSSSSSRLPYPRLRPHRGGTCPVASSGTHGLRLCQPKVPC